ncbi:MAG: peptide chain release factor-like protein [Planctomycetales bacterium]
MVNPRTSHPADLSADELLRECDLQRTRRSGPGGQHRNKVETCVVLTHRSTGVKAEAGERRSLPENQSVALQRLRMRLAVEVRRERPPELIPSPFWRTRCPHGKIVVSHEHADFPSLLAEALDVLQATTWDPKTAAEKLTCTSSQLLKFLKQEPAAWTAFQKARTQLGLPERH